MSALPLDVVIPARDEASLLAACLQAVVHSAGHLDLRIVVVANDCHDRTADVARGWIAVAQQCGHELVVIETTGHGGKSAALNAAEPQCRGVPVVYLDADTVLLPGALLSMATALSATDEPLLVAPAPVILRPRASMARSFAAVWSQLPAVKGDVLGAGCYAVNPQGRAQWGRFPALAADDAFVRSRFRRDQRQVLDPGFLLVLPEGKQLTRMLRRWRAANQQLPGDPGAGDRRNAGHLLRRLDLWPQLPGFLTVSLTARFGTAQADPSWTPERPAASADRPGADVDVVIVTHNSAKDIGRALESLRSTGARLRVTVADNASSDGSARVAQEAMPAAQVIQNATNTGFAAAVNAAVSAAAKAAGGSSSRYLLLVNPDARLGPDAIDALLTVAARFPAAGIYGGRMLTEDGQLDPTSCLATPSLWQAMFFALGLSIIPGGRRFDPDSLSGWRRTGLREVPALTGALLLIDRRIWDQIGGFDEQFFLYGEDVDLCIRARRAGASPMFTAAATYTHAGGASSTGEDRWVWILKGKATLYRIHLSPVSAWAATRALVAGAALRSIVARRAGPTSPWLRVWHRRSEWQDGWTAGAANRPGV